jgi:hypothetical protein
MRSPVRSMVTCWPGSTRSIVSATSLARCITMTLRFVGSATTRAFARAGSADARGSGHW